MRLFDFDAFSTLLVHDGAIYTSSENAITSLDQETGKRKASWGSAHKPNIYADNTQVLTMDVGAGILLTDTDQFLYGFNASTGVQVWRSAVRKQNRDQVYDEVH